MSQDVLVVGAGIAGLSLAWALERRGLAVQLIEATARPGGKIHSERSGGYLCEGGPISLSIEPPEVSALLADIGLEGRLQRARPGRRGVFVGGLGALPVPESLAELAAFRPLRPWDKLALLRGLWPGRGRRGSSEDESLVAFGRRRLGRRASETLLFPSLPGAYAMDPEKISVRAAFPWLADLGRAGLLRTFFDGPRRGVALASFPGGMEELPRALAGALGDRLLLGSPLRSLRRRGRRWVAVVESRGATHEIEADAVALALPAHAAVAVVAPLDPALAAVLASIPFAPISLVQLGFARPAAAAEPQAAPLAIHGLYAPSAESSDLAGAAFPSAMFPDDRAPAGHALAVARFGGARRPDQARLSDHDLTKLAWRELAPPALGPGPPAFAQVVRHEAALPQYTLGHRERLEALAAGEARHPGLFFAGNSYRGLGVVDCITDAERLAERLEALAVHEVSSCGP